MRSCFSTFLFVVFTLLSGLPLIAQNPSLNMTELSRWDNPDLPTHSGIRYNDVWGYADCSGREYAILGSAGRIHFIDVTKPEEPVEIQSFPGSVNSIWRDFKTYRDRAYACADEGTDGLMVFDMSRLPDTVMMTYQNNTTFQRSHNLWVDTLQGRLYMAGTNTQSNGVIIYDLTQNPDEPQLLASIPLPGGYIHDIHVVDNIAYCSHGGNGLWVYDLSDPQNIILLGSMTDYPERGYNHSGWLDADRNFFIMADETHGTSVKVVDVQDFDDIYVRSLFKSALLAPNLGSIIHNPFIRDQYVVMAYYHDGIQIYDMSNPDTVVRTAYYDTYPINMNYGGYNGAWGAYPYLPSGNILGSDITFGLFVLRADSIQFQPGPRHLSPEAAILNVNPALCEGSPLELTAAPGAESYRWFFNGDPIHADESSYVAAEAGYYQVEARNGHCASRSDSVFLELISAPALKAALDTPAFCEGDSARLGIAGLADSIFLIREADGFRELVDLSLQIFEGGIYGIEAYLGACVFTLEDVFEVTVYPITSPEIDMEGPVLQCSNAGQFAHFQWHLDGSPISGADAAAWTAQQSGLYTLETVDANGCYSVSEGVQVVVSSVQEVLKTEIGLFPNPIKAGQSAVVLTNLPLENSSLHLRDTYGRTIAVLPVTASKQVLDTAGLLPGVYFYEWTAGNGRSLGHGKLIVQ